MTKNIAFDRSNIKLHIHSPKVFVQADKKKVVTVLDYEVIVPQVVRRLFEAIYEDPDYYTADIRGTVTGIAVCSDEDTFDEEKGRKISWTRAETHAYQNAAQRLNKRLVDLMDVFNDFGLLAEEFIAYKSQKAINHNNRHIHRLASE